MWTRFGCRLVADLDLDDSPSSKSDASSDHEEDGPLSTSDGTVESVLKGTPSKTQQIIQTISTISSSSSTGEDDEIGDGLRTVTLGPRKSSLVADAEEDLIVVSGGSGPESLLQLHLTSHGHTVTSGDSKSTAIGTHVGASHLHQPNLGHGPVGCGGIAGPVAGDVTSTN
uniref:Uncharacterized protein n=1 Tax=Anopheles maculatus TaxID=74869 RepID=A0A182TBZ3_9DIPT